MTATFEKKIFAFILLPTIFALGLLCANGIENIYIFFLTASTILCFSYLVTVIYMNWYVGRAILSDREQLGFSGIDYILSYPSKLRKLNMMLLHHQKVISDCLPIPFIVTDADLNPHLFSEYAIKIFGENIQKTNLNNCDFAKPLIGASKLACSKKTPIQILLSYNSNNYCADIIPITWRDDVTHIVFFMRDVSGENQFSALLKEFSVNFSHDVRTPVTAIITAAETLESDDFIKDKMGNEFLNIIVNHAKRLKKLSEDFSKITKIQKDYLECGDIYLYELVKSATEDLKSCEKAFEDRIVFESDSKNPIVLGNDHALTNVIKELIENALIHSKNDGAVFVKCQEVIHASNNPVFLKMKARLLRYQ